MAKGPGGGPTPPKAEPVKGDGVTSGDTTALVIEEKSPHEKKKKEKKEKRALCNSLTGQEKLRCEMSAKMGKETGQQRGPNLM